MPKPPNLLLFLPDGMQGRAVNGGAVSLPNFDAVAARGVRFTRAVTPLPTCSPARASLMTGLLPHNHGVVTVEHTVDDDQAVLRTAHPHWAQRLSAAGYRTGYFGKWHIERSNDLARFGWQVNGAFGTPLQAAALRRHAAPRPEPVDERTAGYRTGPEGFRRYRHYGVTDVPVLRRPEYASVHSALDFLREATAGAAPWCCAVSFQAPNGSLLASRETWQRYDVDRLVLPPSSADDLAGRPNFYRRVRDTWADMTPRRWREALACYYARLTEMDTLLGLLLAQLEAAGHLADTLVLITTDHGRLLGAHGMDGHNTTAAEEMYNIPLIAAGPGVARGAVSPARVGLQDVCPTLLELAGLAPFAVPDSRSFAALLRDPGATDASWDRAYAEFHGNRYLLTQRVLWDGPWKLVFNGFDYDELYDLDSDPYELTNLAARPEHRARVEAMMLLLWRRVRETGDRALAEAQYYTLRFPALGPDAT